MNIRQVVNPVMEAGADISTSVASRVDRGTTNSPVLAEDCCPRMTLADAPGCESGGAAYSAGAVTFKSPLVPELEHEEFSAPFLAAAVISTLVHAAPLPAARPFQSAQFVRLPMSGVWDLESVLGGGEPAGEIIGHIVSTALQNAVSAVRLTRGNFGISVEMETAEGWREHTRVPDVLWEDLRQFLRTMARLPEESVTSGQMVVRNGERVYPFRYYEESERAQPRLFLVCETPD